MSTEELLNTSGEALSEVTRLLSGLDAGTAEEVRARTAEAEARRNGLPVLAVSGEEPARAAFLTRLFGEAVLAPDRVGPPGGRLRFRRGRRPDYRLVRKDGTATTFSEQHPDLTDGLKDLLRDALIEVERKVAAVERLSREQPRAPAPLADAQHALGEAEDARVLAAATLAEAREARDKIKAELGDRTSLVPRPRWGFLTRVWMWLTRALVGWLRRAQPSRRIEEIEAIEAGLRQLEARLNEAEQRVTEARTAHEEAEAKRRHLAEALAAEQTKRADATRELDETRRAAAKAEARRDRAEADLAGHQEARREAFRADLRALTDMRARGREVESLEVELPGCPEALVLVDLGLTGNALELQRGWEACRREIDGCLWVGGKTPARELVSVFLHVARVASPDEKFVRALPALLTRQRALAAGRAALDAVRAAEAALDLIDARADASGRARLDRLSVQRSVDARPVDRAMQKIAGPIAERAQVAVRRACDEVGWELEKLGAGWLKHLEGCEDGESLRKTVAQLRETSAVSLRTVERETQAGMLSALTGAARDLHGPLMAEIAARLETVEEIVATPPVPGGSPEFRRRKPEAESLLEAPRRALSPEALSFSPEAVALGGGVQPLRRTLCGGQAANLFNGLEGGFTGRFRNATVLRDAAVKTLRERLESLRTNATADLMAAEPELARFLRDGLERAPTRAFIELERAVDELLRLESAGLDQDLAHFRATLAGVRKELAARHAPLQSRIEALGREIDKLVAA